MSVIRDELALGPNFQGLKQCSQSTIESVLLQEILLFYFNFNTILVQTNETRDQKFHFIFVYVSYIEYHWSVIEAQAPLAQASSILSQSHWYCALLV